MDPLQRLLLTTSWEALEMAGYARDATLSTQSNRIATYFGQAANDWRDVLNNDDIDIYYVPALSRAFGPSRLAFHNKWGGATISLDSACATSTTAIHLACQALTSRECDTAVAGGGSLCVSPYTFAGLSKSGMISDNGGCRTFHDDADGYARGEGIGVVILKRLEDALAENDNVLGVIRGHARTYTTTSTSITHPSAESQARIYREVLRQTAMLPNEIAYVEMHGTGTQAGDVEEINSIIQVLAKQRSKDNPLTVGAVKANVGHGEGAAGVTSLIKVLKMLQERKIPPQPALPFKINRNFPNLNASHVRIAGIGGRDTALRPSPLSRNGKIKCLVSTFDASGGNTCLVVEEAPDKMKKAENPLPHHVVTLSAKTPASLQNNQQRLLDYLVRRPNTSLADLAYTTTARKVHEVVRVGYTGHSTKDIISKLRKSIDDSSSGTPKKPKAMNVIFAFTGQGSQYTAMGKDLFAHNKDYRNMLIAYNQMCEHQGLPGFLQVLSEGREDINAASTVVVQLAIVALEIACARLLKSWGVQPHMVIGHSLGEYAALCVAGVLSVSDTFHLVGKRAQLMEQRLNRGQFAMLAIPKSLKATMHLLAAEINALRQTQVACINAPESTVVSGPLDEIKHFQAVLDQQGSRSTILRTPYGFHSHHIDTILGDFEGIAKAASYSAPSIPVASSLLGKIVEAGDTTIFSAEYLIRQARDCVDYMGAVQAYQKHDWSKKSSFWVEIGPDPTCVSLVRRTIHASHDQFSCIMRSTENNWASISSLLASLYQSGISINWPRYHQQFLDSLTLLHLPTYAFDEKNYWKTFVERSVSGQLRGAEASMQQAPAIPAFSTTSLQRIEKEEVEGQSVSVTFASQTSEAKLYEAIQGHIVNDTPIMSMSIFCDMAKSAAHYVYSKAHPSEQTPTMSIHDVDMTHALIVPSRDPEQIVRTMIVFSGDNEARVRFASSGKKGAHIDHGSLRITFGDTSSWFSQQTQMLFLIDARIRSLKEMSLRGAAHRLMKPVAYRLFDNLVVYGPNYKAMQDVWVDNDCHDAAASIKLSSCADAGNFLYNPFWSDGAIHLGGFLLNSGLKYGDDVGCLCTGLGSWHVLEEFRADESYTTYTAVQETESANMLTGSAYVYNSKQKLIQVVTGLRFHKMKRTTLGAILSSPTTQTKIAANPVQPAQHWSHSTEAVKAGSSAQGVSTDAIDFGVTVTSTASLSESEHDAGKDSGYATPDHIVSIEKFDTFLSIVAGECGCSQAELDPGTVWSDVGLDSLMAITIIAMYRKREGIELPVTFFLDHQTVSEARDALLGPSIGEKAAAQENPEPRDTLHDPIPVLSSVPLSSPVDADDGDVWVDAQQEVKTTKLDSPPEETFEEIIRPSQAILLHGRPDTDNQRLFLLPDGSGSPSCYIGLPSLGDHLNVYAIQSPFVKQPGEYTCSMKAICESFLDAIRTVQPTGPYLLGGFSFGAWYAYEAARLLAERGEVVDQLILIDMSAPTEVKISDTITQQSLNEAGLLPTTGPLTALAKEHYISTVRAMVSYRPSISSISPRRTLLLSSKDGLAAGKHSALAQWAQGSASASRGWERSIPGEILQKNLEGSHFRLLKYPSVSDTCFSKIALQLMSINRSSLSEMCWRKLSQLSDPILNGVLECMKRRLDYTLSSGGHRWDAFHFICLAGVDVQEKLQDLDYSQGVNRRHL